MKKLKLLVAGGIVGAALFSGGAAFAATMTPAPASPAATTRETPACLPAGHDDAWPAVVQGRPNGFDAGDLGGAYLWHDPDGWHLRITHANSDRAVFTGTIHTSGTLIAVQPVKLEAGDSLAVRPDQHTLTFRFANYGHIDGFDFRTACAPALNLDLQRGGTPLPTSRVFEGDTKAHPATNPLRIERTG